MNIRDYVFVVDWGKQYTTLTKWNNKTQKREKVFPIKTEIPDYSGIDFHWECKYEPNLTLKGTINKREPRKLVERIPIYKNYKWEVLEIFKHPNAGKQFYTLKEYTQEQLDAWKDYNDCYTKENLLLIASVHSDNNIRCYVVIEETGVSKLTPEQFEQHGKSIIKSLNLNKWDRNNLTKQDIPKEIISCFYDEDDKVLLGSGFVKGLVCYNYLDAKYSVDNKPIYLGSTVTYDGIGNAGCPNPELIKDFEWIKNFIKV